jgi:hypothetical protein
VTVTGGSKRLPLASQKGAKPLSFRDLDSLKVIKAVPSPAARHAVVQDTGPRAGALVPVALTGAEEVDECHRRHPVGERVHAGTVP